MSAEWFELGQRLWSEQHGVPAPRIEHRTVPVMSGPAVALRVCMKGGECEVTGQFIGGDGWTLSGPSALRQLHQQGASIDAQVAPILVVEDFRAVSNLAVLARQCADSADDAVRSGAAVAGFWADRVDVAGTGAVIVLQSASSVRWVLGVAPSEQRSSHVWQSWLGVEDSCEGLLEWACKLGDGPALAYLDDVHELDRQAWERWQRGADYWTRPATSAGAALDLKSRCDANDLLAAGLLSDRLWRRRATHTGEVVSGTVFAADQRLVISADRMDARLRVGNDVVGWAGSVDVMPFDRFSGTVEGTAVIDGALHLTVNAGRQFRPVCENPVVVMPAPPMPSRLGAGRARYWHLYARRSSWLSTGASPIPARRDVPLDILIAGAEPMERQSSDAIYRSCCRGTRCAGRGLCKCCASVGGDGSMAW